MAFRQRESQSQVLFCNFKLLKYNFNLSYMKVFSHIEATATWPKRSTAAEVWALPLMTFFTYISHIMYLRALPVRNRVVFLQILLVASCDMAVAVSAGPNAAGIMPKVHDM